ncbi:MAG: DUF2520 domain-containing protein [Candidatus Aminicenantes bacterium]|nr:DUF2520 domain-containing protein [Candidatus Aminicenantes bacterium]
MSSVIIIGAGKLGCSLGLALQASGYSIEAITCLHHDSAVESGQILKVSSFFNDPELALGSGNIIFLCPPDSQIKPLVRRLAKKKVDWSRYLVYHTSGLLSSAVLYPLKKQGAKVASFHPIQSFACKQTPPSHWKGIFITLEGDEEAIAEARKIIRTIGAHPLLIDQKNKPLYHAACSLASNHFISLFSLAVEILKEAGFEELQAIKTLKPLVHGTWKNLKLTCPGLALTGPIVRGDLMTIRQHLEALQDFPLALKIYQQLSLVALSIAEKRGLKSSQIKALKRWLQDK